MKWSASLICANLLNLNQELQVLQQHHVDYLHVDVMDGLFVPRLGMYPEMVQAIAQTCSIPIEAHLMLQNPEPYIRGFCQAGAKIITVHLEACKDHLMRVLELIKQEGAQTGVALNPSTDFTGIEYVLPYLDYLLIMGINPGILGQKIKSTTLEKIKKYALYFQKHRPQTQIIIDGGVNFENYQTLFATGASILVGGSQTIFHPAQSLTDNLLRLKNKNFGKNEIPTIQSTHHH